MTVEQVRGLDARLRTWTFLSDSRHVSGRFEGGRGGGRDERVVRFRRGAAVNSTLLEAWSRTPFGYPSAGM
jgi:hypothetical protein